MPTWHPDVQVFDVVEGDRRIASFYLDPYARPGNKRSGAWMSSLCDRSAALAPPNQVCHLERGSLQAFSESLPSSFNATCIAVAVAFLFVPDNGRKCKSPLLM